MAKSINVSGRMSVERFNDEFQKTFGVRCNVKISKWVNADGKATLASIRPKDFKGPSKVDLSIVGNMTVGTLKKRFEENFGVMIELYIGRKIAPDDVTIGAIREGRAKASKGEKPKETAPKTPKPDSAQKPSGSNLTEEQIKDFKEQEKEAEDSWDYRSLADEIAEAGDKDWARKLYQKVEDLAEDLSDYNSIAESVAKDAGLDDKKYAKELYKKAEDLAEDSNDYIKLADSVADEDYLGDKDWARNLFQKAEDLAEHFSEFLAIAMSVATDAGLDDKKYAKELFKKAVDLAEDLSDYNSIAETVADEDYLGDKKYARELYQKAQDLAEDSGDFREIAKSVATDAGLDDKKYAKELYDKALDSDGSFVNFRELCTDYLNDKSIFDEEYFEKAFEKALGLKPSADEYDINSFADSLKEAGETDKLEKLKESSNIEIGITHNIEINGDSIFNCGFEIDLNYYEEQTGDEGPEWFDFIYDFKNGLLIGYDYHNAELGYVRIPDEDEDQIWYLRQIIDDWKEDFLQMMGNDINGFDGEHEAEMEEIVKTINVRAFMELASAVFNKIKELEGIA
jgi:hypothetical protein